MATTIKYVNFAHFDSFLRSVILEQLTILVITSRSDRNLQFHQSCGGLYSCAARVDSLSRMEQLDAGACLPLLHARAK